jgi:hypothetical protein
MTLLRFLKLVLVYSRAVIVLVLAQIVLVS